MRDHPRLSRDRQGREEDRGEWGVRGAGGVPLLLLLPPPALPPLPLPGDLPTRKEWFDTFNPRTSESTNLRFIEPPTHSPSQHHHNHHLHQRLPPALAFFPSRRIGGFDGTTLSFRLFTSELRIPRTAPSLVVVVDIQTHRTTKTHNRNFRRIGP